MEKLVFALSLLSSSAFASGHCYMPRTGQTVSIERFFQIAQQKAQSNHRCVTAATSSAAVGAYQFDGNGNPSDQTVRISGCALLLCNMVD